MTVDVEIVPAEQATVVVENATLTPLITLHPSDEIAIIVNASQTAQPTYAIDPQAIVSIPISVGMETIAQIEDQELDGVADEAILAGQPLYLKPNTRLALAQANNPVTADVRFFAASPTDQAGKTIALAQDGWVERSDWTMIAGTPHLTPNATYFLDWEQPGRITKTPPDSNGLISIELGFATSDRRLQIEIQSLIFL